MHIIRLRGPWQTDDGERVKLPATWDAALGDRRQVVLSRKFNWVRDLEDVSAALLRIDSPQRIERITLNGQEVEAEADVRSRLSAANALSLSIHGTSPEAYIAEIWLEITGAS